MPLHISDLGESLVAKLAYVGLKDAMFSEMVSHVARFLESHVTPLVETLENVDIPLCQWVFYFNHLMPAVRNSFKMLAWDAFMDHLANGHWLFDIFRYVLDIVDIL